MGKERILIRVMTFLLLFGFITLLGMSRGYAAEDAPSIKFLKALKDVMNHGDLADSEHSAKSLGIQLKSSGKNGRGIYYEVADLGKSPISPLQFYYYSVPIEGNKTRVLADFSINADTACIQISEVTDLFGSGGVLSRSIYDFLTQEGYEKFVRNKKHDVDMISFRFPGANRLSATFQFRFMQCLRSVGLKQDPSLTAQ